MNQTPNIVEQIARAVLYEGYILYPYRPSVKNAQRWTFGGIYPKSYVEQNPGSDLPAMQMQCLIRGDGETTIDIAVAFLQLIDRTVKVTNSSGALAPVSRAEVGGKLYQPWQEAVERKIELPAIPIAGLLAAPRMHRFQFEPNEAIETLSIEARLVRRQDRVEGMIEYAVSDLGNGVYRLAVRVSNVTAFDASSACRDDALMSSLVSSHIVLTASNGQFVSQTDTPDDLKPLAVACENIGCWPVLVGQAGATDTLLASPIILGDYPEIAPESPGDLFDGCEIDEILTLRIMTLTDEEKRQAAAVDPKAAEVMARTERLAREQLMNLHGSVRSLKPVSSEAPDA